MQYLTEDYVVSLRAGMYGCPCIFRILIKCRWANVLEAGVLDYTQGLTGCGSEHVMI